MFKFQCLKCRECCYFPNSKLGPILFDYEVEKVLKYARLFGIDLSYFKFEKVDIGGLVLYKWLINGYCPFLNLENNLCRIHNDKPLTCKMYPLLLNYSTGEIYISMDCKWVKEIVRKGIEVNLCMFINELEALKIVIKNLYNMDVEIEC